MALVILGLFDTNYHPPARSHPHPPQPTTIIKHGNDVRHTCFSSRASWPARSTRIFGIHTIQHTPHIYTQTTLQQRANTHIQTRNMPMVMSSHTPRTPGTGLGTKHDYDDILGQQAYPPSLPGTSKKKTMGLDAFRQGVLVDFFPVPKWFYFSVSTPTPRGVLHSRHPAIFGNPSPATPPPQREPHLHESPQGFLSKDDDLITAWNLTTSFLRRRPTVLVLHLAHLQTNRRLFSSHTHTTREKGIWDLAHEAQGVYMISPARARLAHKGYTGQRGVEGNTNNCMVGQPRGS